jgi:hypothetical protein
MKWVKCLYNGGFTYYNNITIGKIYEVVEHQIEMYQEYIKIIQNNGSIVLYAMIAGTDEFGCDRIWFEDVTDEVRDNKINQILND